MPESFKIKIRSFFTFGVSAEHKRLMDADRNLVLEVRDGDTVEDVLNRLNPFGAGVSLEDAALFVRVNGKSASFDYVLRPGDVIDLHAAAMGG